MLVKDWRKGTMIKKPLQYLIQKKLQMCPVNIEGRLLERRCDFMTGLLDLFYSYQDVLTVEEMSVFEMYKAELRRIADELDTNIGDIYEEK